jgi:hypothetical protein
MIYILYELGAYNIEHHTSSTTGVLTEAILHANNSRDIETDTKVSSAGLLSSIREFIVDVICTVQRVVLSQAGAVTLAALIGFENSYKVYVGLFMVAYASAIYISIVSAGQSIDKSPRFPCDHNICHYRYTFLEYVYALVIFTHSHDALLIKTLALSSITIR